MRAPILAITLAAILPSAPLAEAMGVPIVQETDTKKERERRLANEAKSVAKALREKLASDDVAERRAAIVDAAQTDHRIVVDAIAQALGDRDISVVRIALDRLGSVRAPEARKVCKSFARKKKKLLSKDAETHVTVLRAVGRHADPGDIGWLLDGAFDEQERDVRRARIFAAARSRSKDAVEALIVATTRTDIRRVRNRFHQARVALVWLTGRDEGKDPERWSAWWRKEHKSFELPAQPPKMEGAMQAEWRTFWGERREYTRQKKRGDRGK